MPAPDRKIVPSSPDSDDEGAPAGVAAPLEPDAPTMRAEPELLQGKKPMMLFRGTLGNLGAMGKCAAGWMLKVAPKQVQYRTLSLASHLTRADAHPITQQPC